MLFPITTALEMLPTEPLALLPQTGRLGQPERHPGTVFDDPFALAAHEAELASRLTTRQIALLHRFDRDRDGVIKLQELTRYGIKGVSPDDEIFVLMHNPQNKTVIGLPDDNSLFGRVILENPDATGEEVATLARLLPLSHRAIRATALNLLYNHDGKNTITEDDLKALGIYTVPSSHPLASVIRAKSLIGKEVDAEKTASSELALALAYGDSWTAATGRATGALQDAAAAAVLQQASEIETLAQYSVVHQKEIEAAQAYAAANETELRTKYGNSQGNITLSSLDKFGIEGVTSQHPLYHLMDNPYADHEIGDANRNSFYASTILRNPDATAQEIAALAGGLSTSAATIEEQAIHSLYNQDGVNTITKADLARLGIHNVPEGHVLTKYIRAKSVINSGKGNTAAGNVLLKQASIDANKDAAALSIRDDRVAAVYAQHRTIEGIQAFAVDNADRIDFARQYAERFEKQLLEIFDTDTSGRITSKDLRKFGIYGVPATSPLYHLMNDAEGDYIIGEITKNLAIANLLLHTPTSGNAILAQAEVIGVGLETQAGRAKTVDTFEYFKAAVNDWDTNTSGTISVEELKIATQQYNPDGSVVKGSGIRGVHEDDPWYRLMSDPDKNGWIGDIRWRKRNAATVSRVAQQILDEVDHLAATAPITVQATNEPELRTKPPVRHAPLTPGQELGLTIFFDRRDGILHRNDLAAKGIYQVDSSHPLYNIIGDPNKNHWSNGTLNNTPAGKALLDRTRENIPDASLQDPYFVEGRAPLMLTAEASRPLVNTIQQRFNDLAAAPLSEITDIYNLPRGHINRPSDFRYNMHRPTAEGSLPLDILNYHTGDGRNPLTTATKFRHFFLPLNAQYTDAILYKLKLAESIPNAPLEDLLILKTITSQHHKRTNPLRTETSAHPAGYNLKITIPERAGLPKIRIYTRTGSSLTEAQHNHYVDNLPRILLEWQLTRGITSFPRGYNADRTLAILVDDQLKGAFGLFNPKYSAQGINAIQVSPGATANHQEAIQHELDHWLLQLHADTLVKQRGEDPTYASMVNAIRFIFTNTSTQLPTSIPGENAALYQRAFDFATTHPDPNAHIPPHEVQQAHDPRFARDGKTPILEPTLPDPEKTELEIAPSDQRSGTQSLQNLFSTQERIDNIRTLQEHTFYITGTLDTIRLYDPTGEDAAPPPTTRPLLPHGGYTPTLEHALTILTRETIGEVQHVDPIDTLGEILATTDFRTTSGHAKNPLYILSHFFALGAVASRVNENNDPLPLLRERILLAGANLANAPFDDLLTLGELVRPGYPTTDARAGKLGGQSKGYNLYRQFPATDTLPTISIYTTDGHNIPAQRLEYLTRIQPENVARWMREAGITEFPRGYGAAGTREIRIYFDERIGLETWTRAYVDHLTLSLGQNAIFVDPTNTPFWKQQYDATLGGPIFERPLFNSEEIYPLFPSPHRSRDFPQPRPYAGVNQSIRHELDHMVQRLYADEKLANQTRERNHSPSAKRPLLAARQPRTDHQPGDENAPRRTTPTCDRFGVHSPSVR